ncbi:unnamed protein product [Rotaria socialis]|uniref:Uncharacterized protein n=1 Tax=Rotaria socialis TaxID=392032 RepID=A0A818V115_9BILA|nr:unnamed protein product [Rotaria socialis]CAF4416622.1 unnamed protein product [Rotaria socialis]
MSAMAYQRIEIEGEIYKIPVIAHDGIPCILFDEINRSFGYNYVIVLRNEEGVQLPLERNEDLSIKNPQRTRANVDETFIAVIEKRSDDCEKKMLFAIMQIQEQIKQMLDKQDLILLSEKRIEAKLDAIFLEIYELAEYTVPRLFIVLPERGSSWNPSRMFKNTYRLFFLCECDNIHCALHEGYIIEEPKTFFRRYGSHIARTMKVIQYAISIGGGFFFPVLASINNVDIPTFLTDQNFWNSFVKNMNIMANFLEHISLKKTDLASFGQTHPSDSVELRGIKQFLGRYDTEQTLGRLYRVVKSDGAVKWLCKYHYDNQFCTKEAKAFVREFETKRWGHINKQMGEAIVKEKVTSTEIRQLITMFRRGSNIYKLTLHDCRVNDSDLEFLLSSFQTQSFLRDLEFVSLSVDSWMGDRSPASIVQKLECSSIHKSLMTVTLSISRNYTERLDEATVELAIRTLMPDFNARISVNFFLKIIGVEAAVIKSDKHFSISGSISTKVLNSLATALGKNAHVRQLVLTQNRLKHNGIDLLARNVIRNTSITDLCLSRNELGDFGVTPLLTLLRLSKVLKCLSLELNRIGDNGAFYIAEAIKNNLTLESLNLSYNRIGISGAQAFAECLLVNAALQALNLSNNTVYSEGAAAITNALSKNQSLKILNLSHNEIKRLGSKADVKNFLINNHSIRDIDLSLNSFADSAILGIAEGLSNNSTLITLNLTSNEFGNKGIIGIFEALLENLTLQHLFIGDNKISDNAVESMLTMFHDNSVLKSISIRAGQFSTDGFSKILRYLEQSVLTSIDLSYSAFHSDEEFYILADSLRKNDHLQTVDLSGVGITNRQLRRLAKAFKYPTNSVITHLNLSSNTIDQRGASTLADMLALNNTLLELNLEHNRINDDALKLLLNSLQTDTKCPLRRLLVGNNDLSTASGLLVEQFNNANEHVNVLLE